MYNGTHRARDGMSNGGVHSSSSLLHSLSFSSIDGRFRRGDDSGSMSLHGTCGPSSSHRLDVSAIMHII